jgi:hypothetical protein
LQEKSLKKSNRSVTAGRDAALRRPDGAARRPYHSRPAVTDRLPKKVMRPSWGWLERQGWRAARAGKSRDSLSLVWSNGFEMKQNEERSS